MKKIVIALAALPFVLLVQPAMSKEPQNTTLETITVTAQKQEENIQEVPVSISVLDEYAIEDNNIKTMSDIALSVPNFQQFSVGGAGMYNPGMRGLSADVHTMSSTVAAYVDGIPYLTSMGNDLILEDIERIEVLRGPQGTLYGKNAYAGVINIISKKPDNNFRGKIKAELGQDNKREYTTNISGPIVKDTFYAGLSVRHDEKDGFIQNAFLGKKDDDRKDNAMKLYLRYEPASAISVSLVSNYMEKDDGSSTVVPLGLPDLKTVNSNFEGYTDSKSQSHALTIEHKWDKISLTSISTYKRYDDIRGSDYDYSPVNMMHSEVDSKFVDYSQEVRLNGEAGRFSWLGGIFLDKSDEEPFYTMNGVLFQNNITENKGLGIFANLDYELSDRFILISGIRYDRDEIEIKDHMLGFQGDKSYNEISPKIGIKYLHNENFSSYATVSKGYKRGGYYLLAPAVDQKSYDPETLINYEVGLKSQFLENRLQFNASVFCMDITDMQVTSSIDPYTGYMSNAAEATSKGFELEASWKMFEPLVLFANIGYAKTEFDSFSDNLGDYSGNDTPFAPAYNYTMGFLYRDKRGIFARFDLNGQDSFYADKANTFKNDSYAIMNAKIGYEGETFEVYCYGKNLADKEYNLEGYGGAFTMLSPPRELGVQLAYRF